MREPQNGLTLRHTALVIVDLQHDFLSPGGAYDRGGAVSAEARALPCRIELLVRRLKDAGGLVAASRFTLWPDAQGEPMIAAHLRTLRPFLRRGDFAPGSRGQATVDRLQPLVDVSVDKVAYSAFFSTQLDWVLKKAGIDTVVIAGIVTNGGVASTARDAHAHEYHTIVLSDGCVSFRAETHATALADLATVAEVLDCQSLLSRWSTRP